MGSVLTEMERASFCGEEHANVNGDGERAESK